MGHFRSSAILLILLLSRTFATEDVEPIFKAVGETLEMGFCFGDDIAVYKQTAGKKELLGQASNPLFLPPAAFKDRVSVSNELIELLGMEIKNLQISDTGIYIRECWSDKKMDNYNKNFLYVCKDEIGLQELSLTTRTGADLRCNVNLGKDATIKWYRDLDNITLFMDTSVSLKPLQEEFKSLIQVINGGSALHVSDEFIKDRPSFFCQVMEDGQCRGFQSIKLPAEPEVKTVYRSVGEELILKCSVNRLRGGLWKTPLGQVNATQIQPKGSPGSDKMFVSTSMDSEDYNLVIPTLFPDYSGSFKCFSTFLVEEYYVIVCPLLETSDILFTADQNKVVLPCNLSLSENIEHASVQWYQKSDEKDLLILDSEDPSLSLPNDLEGRVRFSGVDSSLIFTHPKPEDNGTYWCVCFLNNFDYNYEDPESIVGDFDNEDGEEKEEKVEVETEEHFSTDEEDIDRCFSRQVTHLYFAEEKIRMLFPHGSTPQADIKSHEETSTQPEPEPETNLLMYAVCGGIGALLVLVSIGVVVFLKMRSKKSSTSHQNDLQLSEEEGKALKGTKP